MRVSSVARSSYLSSLLNSPCSVFYKPLLSPLSPALASFQVCPRRSRDRRIYSLTAYISLSAAHSHEGPKSAEEKASLARLKEASYLCAPQIAAYNAQRELAWSQKVLGGASYAEKRKFIEGGWNDIADQMKSIDGAHETDSSDKRILACEAVAGSKIRNHTCVLAPESTEGPYFHASSAYETRLV
jgi:hypothetical protein